MKLTAAEKKAAKAAALAALLKPRKIKVDADVAKKTSLLSIIAGVLAIVMLAILTFVPTLSYSVTMEDADDVSDLAVVMLWETVVYGEEDEDVLKSDRWTSDGYVDEGSFSVFGAFLLNSNMLLEVLSADATDSNELWFGVFLELFFVLYLVAVGFAVFKAVKAVIGAIALYKKPVETVYSVRPKLTFQTRNKRKLETFGDYTYSAFIVVIMVLLIEQMIKSMSGSSVASYCAAVNYMYHISGIAIGLILLVAVMIASIVIGSMIRKTRVGVDVTDEE